MEKLKPAVAPAVPSPVKSDRHPSGRDGLTRTGKASVWTRTEQRRAAFKFTLLPPAASRGQKGAWASVGTARPAPRT